MTTQTETQSENIENLHYDPAYGYLGPNTPVVESPTPAQTPYNSDVERLLWGPSDRLDEELGQRLSPLPAENTLRRTSSARTTEDIELQNRAGHATDISRVPTPHFRENGAAIVKTISNKLIPDPHTLQREVSNLQNVTPGTLELGEATHSTDPPCSPTAQGVPPELPNFLAEIVFILVCSTAQLFFAILQGNIIVNQVVFLEPLGIASSQAPWLNGSFLLANGLSVVISGSLADLARPKHMMVGAFIWMTVWQTIGAFSIHPSRQVLFFVVRAMQGLAIGVLVSASMSVLGRIYKPGLRKTRVFSAMAAMAPFGYWIGCLQGGALSGHLSWIFGSSAILSGLMGVAAILTIPPLAPARDAADRDAPSLRDFDFAGAACVLAGCACLLFGLTQGAPTGWTPYTYTLVVVGVLLLAAFPLIERRVARPLLPNRLWATPGFTPLIVAYFLGFGGYLGAWAFYAVRFWLDVQGARPLTVALYITPNAVVGVVATLIVSRTLHAVAGHHILLISMLAYALGPVFMLPQTAATPYAALSLPGIALVTFGPDLSFAAASIFVTSAVSRSYQGAAGSLLVTIQNLSGAVVTAAADALGRRVTARADGELDLAALRAIWWFGFGLSMAGALICAVKVRMPKSEEKEHAA